MAPLIRYLSLLYVATLVAGADETMSMPMPEAFAAAAYKKPVSKPKTPAVAHKKPMAMPMPKAPAAAVPDDSSDSDSGSDAPSDVGSDSGSDAGSAAPTDAGSDSGSDAGSAAGATAGSDAGSDTGADAGSDAGSGDASAEAPAAPADATPAKASPSKAAPAKLVGDAATISACNAIKGVVQEGELLLPGDDGYTTENKNWYNMGLADLEPACIVQPTSAQEVSSVVKILNQHSGVKFAVKSGGHDPNKGQSSVAAGVLIALSRMNTTHYDSANKVAHLGPGGRWTDVIHTLDPQGVTVLGGRVGIVGVGGYLMQGGLSFLSSQYGLACDNILEYETVLANGTIATINLQNNKDLVRAMRGSGDQFGITTKFTLRTYPIGKVWGGVRMFTNEQKDDVLAGLHDFIGKPKDPKAAIIFTAGQSGGNFSYAVAMFYDGAKPPTGAFGKLGDIKQKAGLTTTMNYRDMVAGHFKIGTRTSFRSITLPYIPNHPQFYAQIEEAWKNITTNHGKLGKIIQTTLAFQPVPNSIGAASDQRGGNAMGLTGKDKNRFILEIASLWYTKLGDELALLMGRQLTTAIDQILTDYKATSKAVAVEEYTPFFMNDANSQQDVTGSYKEKALFAQLQKQHDPNGFFSKRAGGFYYS